MNDPGQTPASGRSSFVYTAPMRFIGLDYGTARIGVAVSDEAGAIAFPRTVLPNDDGALAAVGRIVAETGAGTVVMGDARALSGAENKVTARSDAFAEALAAVLTVPVVRTAEGWSSFEAARFAPKGKTHDDAAAAAIILQRYLDMKAGRVE